MRSSFKSIVGLTLLLLMPWHMQGQQSSPYKDRPSSPLIYNGPGSDEPDPVVAEVTIAYFGPASPDGSDSLWNGASLAIAQVNHQGGYLGKPFRLVAVWDANPWTGGVAKLVRAAYAEKVWAVIGGIDGATTHLAEQVTTKLPLTLINPAATDRSIHTAHVPWMFTCVPGDHLSAALISEAIRTKGEPFALVSGTDHDSRAFVAQLNLAFPRSQVSPAAHIEVERASDAAAIVQRVIESKVKAVIVVAEPGDSVKIIIAMRRAGLTGAVFGDPRLRRSPEQHLSGEVWVPVLGDIPPEFSQQYSARFDRLPDYAAAHAYDATMILVEAIRKAGLNRVRIREAVRALSPYSGITGVVRWDPVGQNERPVLLQPLIQPDERAIGGASK